MTRPTRMTLPSSDWIDQLHSQTPSGQFVCQQPLQSSPTLEDLSSVQYFIITDLLPTVISRLGHNIFRRAHQRHTAGGECEGVGQPGVRQQLQAAGSGCAGHHAVCRGDQQGLLSGGLGGTSQLSGQQQMGTVWSGVMGGKVC